MNRKTITSFVCGFLLASALFAKMNVAAVDEPSIVGDSGYLSNVEVIGGNGDVVCGRPYWSQPKRRISCPSDVAP